MYLVSAYPCFESVCLIQFDCTNNHKGALSGKVGLRYSSLYTYLIWECLLTQFYYKKYTSSMDWWVTCAWNITASTRSWFQHAYVFDNLSSMYFQHRFVIWINSKGASSDSRVNWDIYIAGLAFMWPPGACLWEDILNTILYEMDTYQKLLIAV